ncbi:MAG: nitroreductase [SAR324 cluster bacterium]|nr:nitroreductase [SAR324 cluster bacterium]
MPDNHVIVTIKERHSCRDFTDKIVTPEQIHQILDASKHTPSSTNMQPWEVVVVTGEAKKKLDSALLDAFDTQVPPNHEMSAYLEKWEEPFKSRRFECGVGLYEALGIGRKDKETRLAQTRKNFNAFGAPAVLIFYMDRILQEGSLFDMGLFLQTVMLSAQSLGLATCAEASLVAYSNIVKEMFKIPKEKRLIIGLALGYRDTKSPVNTYRTKREPVEKFTRFFS